MLIVHSPVRFFKTSNQTDFTKFENEINEFLKEGNNSQPKRTEIKLFEFNPNTISNQEWKKLGFEAWQIKTINNYKAKGGNWKTKSEVKKIYGLKDSHYRQLKSYILLPDETPDKINKKEFNEITYFKFDPNTISKNQWKKLGFKDWQINTIFNYKSKGGNWKTKSDVQQIYGLDEADFIKLKPYLLLPDKTATTTSKSKKNARKANWKRKGYKRHGRNRIEIELVEDKESGAIFRSICKLQNVPKNT